METAQTRRHNQKCLLEGGPLSPTLTDYLVQSLGGTTTAFETMPAEVQKKKDPISEKARIEELTRENGRLRWEVARDRSVVEEMALVKFQAERLYSAVQKLNARIEQFNAYWQFDQE